MPGVFLNHPPLYVLGTRSLTKHVAHQLRQTGCLSGLRYPVSVSLWLQLQGFSHCVHFYYVDFGDLIKGTYASTYILPNEPSPQL